MKHRLLDLLACPDCGRFPLEMTVIASEPVDPPVPSKNGCSVHCSAHNQAITESGNERRCCEKCYGEEITQGVLHCGGCEEEYPIIDGIPRFTPDIFDDYPEFPQKYRQHFRGKKARALENFKGLHSHTKKSFGFQWLRFELGVGDHDYHRALWFRRTELKPGGFSNQLFFEAGCGMGRYLRVVGEDPTAEVVGLDLSQAALRAYAENRHNPRIHVVQGNILQMPFRPEIFDHAYSIGVLHHTPSTEMAFRSMARLVKPGGRATVWLYHVWRSPDMKGLAAVHAQLKGAITDGLRAITTRMPHSLLEKFCYLAVPVGWMQRKIMNGPAPLKALLSPMLLVNCSVDEKWQVRVCDTFDWYSPMYQWKHTVPEVAGWFKSLGMTDISTQGFPVSVRGTKPKTQSADEASSQGKAYHLRST